MKKKQQHADVPECNRALKSINDTMDILSGKWKIKIIAMLMKYGSMRFMDLLRDIDGIAAKMLSKELQDLEINQLVKRTVMNTKPVTVEYELTAHGRTLEKLIAEIERWGTAHRKKIMQLAKG